MSLCSDGERDGPFNGCCSENFQKDDQVRWRDKRRLRKGVVVSTLTTRTGRVRVQVRVTPDTRSTYAGQASVRASQLERVT